ncbi:hypothetical protein BRYFOR_05478 [Marvinbryantia formatexigens DSM 14469]|uniref:Uncharacterized protein n=1 Tax=Marvinbryantia formatexigens DSM 14469 TaxID=478749 RepID=C6LA36_9FIRM|nr:hypothetical protein BRYFOR_05478 [Marvinbryantia formatexigens DSM 14469]
MRIIAFLFAGTGKNTFRQKEKKRVTNDTFFISDNRKISCRYCGGSSQ